MRFADEIVHCPMCGDGLDFIEYPVPKVVGTREDIYCDYEWAAVLERIGYASETLTPNRSGDMFNSRHRNCDGKRSTFEDFVFDSSLMCRYAPAPIVREVPLIAPATPEERLRVGVDDRNRYAELGKGDRQRRRARAEVRTEARSMAAPLDLTQRPWILPPPWWVWSQPTIEAPTRQTLKAKRTYKKVGSARTNECCVIPETARKFLCFPSVRDDPSLA
jgi:hypothetical protein